MKVKPRRIAAFLWYWAKRLLAYLFAGIDWLFQAIATGCMVVADLAEDAAVGLRR